MVFVYSIPDLPTRGQYIITIKFCSQAVYKMSVAASLTKPNPLTAEECTNRIFVRLDKDNNGTLLSHWSTSSHFEVSTISVPAQIKVYRKLCHFFVFPFL